MFYVLASALSASLVSMLTVWALHTSFALSFSAEVGDIGFYACHGTRAAPYLWVFLVIPLAYDTLVFCLAVYKGYRMYRANLGSRVSLAQVLVRDSVVYFIVISETVLTVLLIWLTDKGVDVITKGPVMPVVAVPLVTCCHLMLNLRESYEKASVVTTTQGTALSEWNTRFREPPLDRGLDSMGLQRLSAITRVDSDE